jgi:hypothetical protein
MNTDELIALLANQNLAVDRRRSSRRFAWSLALGFAGAGLLAIGLLGVRADTAPALHLPMYWWKILFAASLAGASLLVTRRIATPGRKVGLGWLGIAAPVAIAATAAWVTLLLAPRESWGELIRGETWRVCPFLIALISMPALVGSLAAVRNMAPTRLGIAGAACGLLAGSLATIAYCVHCPEMAVPFWALWYTAGMLIPTAVGALVGPRVLRW